MRRVLSRSRDQGSITLFAVVFFFALFAAAGLVVDGGAKLRAAREATADAGSVTVAGDRKIRVTVTINKPTTLLALIGIGDVHATKTATADLLHGIEGPGR
jgi:hypothetical protein